MARFDELRLMSHVTRLYYENEMRQSAIAQQFAWIYPFSIYR